jgi:hypothetical protein
MDKYKDIINLPHKQSTKRPHMPLLDRAAQFAPFAALTGYDDAVKETARLTDEKIEMSEENLNVLNTKYQILVDRLDEEHEVTFTYFVPDGAKSGGAYVTKQGIVKKVDDFERLITLCDGTRIPMDDILTIDGDIFGSAELL